MTPQRKSLTVPHVPAAVRDPASAWVVAALVFAVAVAAVLRDGGFWPDAARLVAVASALLWPPALLLGSPDRRTALVLCSLVLFSAWWLVRAGTTGSVGAFLRSGQASSPSLLPTPRCDCCRERPGAGGPCDGGPRRGVRLLGLVGLTWRISPLALPAQGLWRMSSSVTYADAAGLVCGVCLLLALGCARYPVFVRIAVCVTSAGLLASRAGVPSSPACVQDFWCRGNGMPSMWSRLLAGVALGVTAIATSPGSGPVPAPRAGPRGYGGGRGP